MNKISNFYKLLLPGLFLLVLQFSVAQAQNITKSPYSIIGVGDIVFGGNTANYTMGQTAQGRRGFSNINILNPASYSSLSLTNIEAGAVYSQGKFTGDAQTNYVNNAWIGYLNFGIPLGSKEKQGISFGLTPYSAVGYNIRSTTIIPHDSADIQAIDYMSGRGGLSRVYFGYGIKVFKFASLGINANYLFGQITSTTQRLIPAAYNMFNSNRDLVNYVKGTTFDLGIQLHDSVKISGDFYEWTLGGTITPQTNLNVEQSDILRNLPVGSTSGIKDTVYNNQSLKGVLVSPLSWKAGFCIGQVDKWQFSADLKATNWSNYKIFGQNDSLRNSYGYGFGASITPDWRNNKNFFKRVEYRFGYRYEQSNLSVNGIGVDLWAITAGFGIPITKSRSKFNLGFEYSQRGTATNQLIKEDYFRVIVGISFTDKWFYHHRYD